MASTMDRRGFLRTTGAGLVALQAVAQAKPEGTRPNIVFLLADQWRASATGYAGDPNVKTPHLDALAAESINFTNAVSVCPVCTPYRAALMTGRYPTSTGMFMNDLYLPDGELCMAELFRDAGYTTGYVGKWHLDGHGRGSYIPPERRQGFDYWKTAECDHNYPRSHYYAGTSSAKRFWKGYDSYAQTADAERFIRTHAGDDAPFLLMVGYGTPHFPHSTAPEDCKALYPQKDITLPPNVPLRMARRAREEASGYYGHCTALDRCVGRLVQTLEESGAADHTILVFTSDHGEMLGAQGVPPCEKQRPWDESIRVPFLLRYPAKLGREGRRIEPPLNTPDILPTLLALSGLPIPKTVEGMALAKLIADSDAQEDRAALIMTVSPFAGYHKGKEFRGIRTRRYTYVRALDGPWLLYDNETDPYQMENLVNKAELATLQGELEELLQSRLRAIGDAFLPGPAYLARWRYKVDERGCISYKLGSSIQGPTRKR